MEVVAEGIEDRETLEAVTAAGVRYAQGYFLGRPAPIVPGGPLSRLTMPAPDAASGQRLPGASPFRVRSRITDRRRPSRNAARALPADH